MDSIRDIIPQVIESLLLKKPHANGSIHEAWKVAAKEHAEHSTVKNFQKGMLWVNVDSSARMFQLSTFKGELVKNLKKEIPELSDIIFKVGKIN